MVQGRFDYWSVRLAPEVRAEDHRFQGLVPLNRRLTSDRPWPEPIADALLATALSLPDADSTLNTAMDPVDEVAKEAARRQEQILTRLRNDLKNNRLAIITGAGVTLNVTADASGKPLSRITWTGLIRNGLDYLVSEGYVDTSNRRTKRAYESLEDPEVDGLLDAANIVSSQMKQHGQFPTWLESVFRSLSQETRHPDLLNMLKALHERGATLLTTNYDDVLEKYCGLQRVGRSNYDDISRFQRGDINGVFYIHRSYHDAQEVVLDTTDYYEVKHSDVVQDMLKPFLQDCWDDQTEKQSLTASVGSDSTRDQTPLYKQCLRDLRATNPRIDKRRIEGSKDRLLQGSCSWLVRDAAFQSWWAHDDPHLLWIHGDPGKGKTMMMLSLYSELSSRIKATGSGAVVSYFFCQSTDPRLNHAVAVLRGLIFLLVAQDKQTLLPHLREKLDETEDLEGSSNLLYALFQMLIDLSIESRFSKVYLMIDALDECNSELSLFLGEIARSESLSYKIKWLVTSRNEMLISKGLSSYGRPCLTLELKSTHVSGSKSTVGAKAADLEQTKKRKRSPKRKKVAEVVTSRLDALANGLGKKVDKEGKPKEKHAPSKEAVKTSDAAPGNVDDLIDAAGNIPKKERKQKAHTYGLTPGYSPFLNYPMPTPEACEEVTRVLSELYGEVGPLPSIDVTGCSEVPDLLGAILRALLRTSTTTKHSNMALKGLQDTFGLRESGKNKGSINWEAVLRADLLIVIEAIKPGGFATVKGTNIKNILDTVYKQNRERRDTLAKEKDKGTGKPADILGPIMRESQQLNEVIAPSSKYVDLIETLLILH
ncbi:uncharacterized protein PAC_18537 [Phialocephala subalpina]|uniref:NACHT domain-containing protein n=1 Tax=Phialocephala subalpina TaxID=576137 RepID=A0A1L7XUD4_9HELO|nr:uncharacterized protein PAC_18537 [Phialocephala subalpina]